VTLHVAALRERKADIRPLAESMLAKALRRYASPARRFALRALAAMERYPWPGNVRELQHVVERSVLLAQEEEIVEADLQLSKATTSSGDAAAAAELAEMTLEQAELWLIQQHLSRHQGNAVEAAKTLGISRSALYRRLGKKEPS